jgi:lipoate-protein ligase A
MTRFERAMIHQEEDMINKIQYIVTDDTNPYNNIAMEEYLLRNVEEGTCILYLWQNKHTIVIGRNQNCWKECKVAELEADGGHLARRLSGGGAVFHDMGNLNFTFLIPEEDYDVDKQLGVIVEACRLLGIHAEKTGRNDITVDGKKFSGNAFYKTDGRCYHHGTLMVQVDLENVSHYLNVSADKLKAKGVSSVKSRVTNLSEFHPGLTIETMRDTIIEAFQNVYGLKAEKLTKDALPKEILEERAKFFDSPAWKYGKHLPFSYAASKRFAWGDVDLHLQVKEGKIEHAEVFSDAMDETFLLGIPEVLAGCAFDQTEIADRLSSVVQENEEQKQIIEDIKQLLLEQ